MELYYFDINLILIPGKYIYIFNAEKKKILGGGLSDFLPGGLDPMGGGDFAGGVGPLVDTMTNTPHPSIGLPPLTLGGGDLVSIKSPPP